MRILASLAALVALAAPASAVVQSGGPGAGNGLPTGNGGNSTFIEGKLSLVGQTFEIAISDGTVTKLSRLTFRTKDLGCDYFDKWNITSVPYTETAGRAKSVAFTGKLTDASGNGLEISGTATEESITGSIDVTKKGEKQTYAFTGGAPGSDAAKAARTEAEASKKASKKK